MSRDGEPSGDGFVRDGLRNFAKSADADPQLLFGIFGCVLGVGALHSLFELGSPWECGWRIDHASLRWHVQPTGFNAVERRNEAEPGKYCEVEIQMADVREVRDRKPIEIVMTDGSVHKLPREFYSSDDTSEIVEVIKAHFPHVVVKSGTSYPRVRYWRDKDR